MAPETVVITVTFVQKPGMGAELERLIQVMFPETRQFPGCLSIQACRKAGNSRDVIFIEEWESPAAYDAYRAWRDGQAPAGGGLAACFEGPPQVAIWQRMAG